MRRDSDAVATADRIQFSPLVEALADAVVATDVQGRIIFANTAAQALFGHSRDEMIGRPVEMLVPEPMHESHVGCRKAHAANPEHRPMSSRGSFAGLRRDGTTFEAQVSLSPAELEGVQATIAVVRDITSIVARDRDAQQQILRLQVLNRVAALTLDHADVHATVAAVLAELEAAGIVDFAAMVAVQSGTGTSNIIGASPRALQMHREVGITDTVHLDIDAMGLRPQGEVCEFYVPDVRIEPRLTPPFLVAAGVLSTIAVPCQCREGDAAVGLLLASRCVLNGFEDQEREFLRALGQQLSLAIAHNQAIEDLHRKNEELRNAQQAALQQARLRALGEMAAGVVHDINNAVSPIIGLADLMLEQPGHLDPPLREAFEVTRMAAGDIAEIATRMRTFFRQRKEGDNLTQVRANDVVVQALQLARARLRDIPERTGAHIDVQTDLWHETLAFYGVEAEIRESLLNLILNAADAMPQGGRLVVRTSRRGPGRELPREALVTSPEAMAACESVWIEVEDTGVGMDARTRQRCIEPFFSTKGDAGSGLGLATVFGTVRRHEGTLDIASEPGRGSTFRIGLPVRFPARRKAIQTSRSLTQAPRHGLHVLHIDDERLMRVTVQRMLESLGHRVHSVASGQDAIAAVQHCETTGAAFDVVITDLGMPQLNGAETARQVRRLAPALPIILLTGWDDVALDGQGQPAAVDATLHKPVSVADLRNTLAAVMAAEQIVR